VIIRTRNRGSVRSLLLAAAASLLLAACAADTEDLDVGEIDDEPADEPAADEPAADGSVSLVANPWPGSYANAHVAAIILEQELGVDAEIVEIDENAQWAGLDDGSLDAVLEIWPSGHLDNLETYTEELGTVEVLGELGAVGQIGWFVPSYVVEEHPEMASWEGLQGNEELFATAETGDSGQFLAADPSFVQFDEHIINNLGLDFEVIQSGSEAAQLAAVEAAIEREEPVLFYFYTPHWLHAQYDLTMVELPEWTEECEELPEAERDCGYPEDVLLKAAHAGLSDDQPDVHAFLTEFTMENEWQDEITFAMDVEGLDAEEAARQWVDANEDAWRAWLP
jgi:glycine betaine/proline transport system substrate-binding protein